MSVEVKEESNSTPTDVKDEDSSKVGEKTGDESSKDSDKESVKDSAKEDSVKSESGKEDSDEDGDEEEMGLFDRPVEVTGCRARKKVERLELSFATPKEKEKPEIPEGKGQKLGLCPRIEYQLQRCTNNDLKPLHRILFNRVSGQKDIKKNIRKFSGFTFDHGSQEFLKKKIVVEKFTTVVLKQICEILDIERGGTKDELVTRIVEFLLEPKESGKKVVVKSKRKTPSKDKKKNADKKSQKSKSKKSSSGDEVESLNDSAGDVSENSDKDEEMTDEEPKKTPKSASKQPASKSQTKKAEKSKKEEKKAPKGSKRKREDDSDESSSSDIPAAKKDKMPSDEEIKKLVKRILDSADLQEITMKKVIKQVSDAYPDFDLSHKKAFIKTTIKSLLNV